MVYLLPALPPELFALILAFADRGTVAVASRVCYGFLKDSGPLLYRNIVIRRHDQLARLFYDRDSDSIALSIEPYVSLAQIRTFRISPLFGRPLTSEPHPGPLLPDFGLNIDLYHSRLPNGFPLHVDLLAIEPSGPEDLPLYGSLPSLALATPADLLGLRNQVIAQRNLSALLRLFDPFEVVLRHWNSLPQPQALGAEGYDCNIFVVDKTILPNGPTWLRIERATYVGCCFMLGRPVDRATIFTQTSISYRTYPYKEPLSPLRVVYDLREVDQPMELLTNVLVDLEEGQHEITQGVFSSRSLEFIELLFENQFEAAIAEFLLDQRLEARLRLKVKVIAPVEVGGAPKTTDSGV